VCTVLRLTWLVMPICAAGRARALEDAAGQLHNHTQAQQHPPSEWHTHASLSYVYATLTRPSACACTYSLSICVYTHAHHATPHTHTRIRPEARLLPYSLLTSHTACSHADESSVERQLNAHTLTAIPPQWHPSMCTCKYLCMYPCIHAHTTNIQTRIWKHTYKHTYIHTYIHTYVPTTPHTAPSLCRHAACCKLCIHSVT
jgi:hypothetical protein